MCYQPPTCVINHTYIVQNTNYRPCVNIQLSDNSAMDDAIQHVIMTKIHYFACLIYAIHSQLVYNTLEQKNYYIVLKRFAAHMHNIN